MDDDFQRFWAVYPRKVGIFAARKAYVKARNHATEQEILDGVARYIQHKPDYADWCHASTWLNQGRWLDDYTPVQQPAKPQSKTGMYKPFVPSWRREETGT